MSRKNRKKKINGFIFPAPFAGAVALISAFALGYVWLGCRCDSLGDEIKILELERTVLNQRFLTEEYKWARMKSPHNIERVLAKYNIKMTWPRRDQVVRLYDSDVFLQEPLKVDNALTYIRSERNIMND